MPSISANSVCVMPPNLYILLIQMTFSLVSLEAGALSPLSDLAILVLVDSSIPFPRLALLNFSLVSLLTIFPLCVRDTISLASLLLFHLVLLAPLSFRSFLLRLNFRPVLACLNFSLVCSLNFLLLLASEYLFFISGVLILPLFPADIAAACSGDSLRPSNDMEIFS